MCIIIVAREKPDFDLLHKSEWGNPHGGGISWQKDGKVHFKKNLDAKAIYKIVEENLPPYIIHFRVSTVGGEVPELTHPFPIGGDLALSGQVDNVLFHNGHWGEWKTRLMDTQLTHPLPPGVWSDTRAMAYLSEVYKNTNWIKLITDYPEYREGRNKIAIMTKDRIKFFGEWVKYAENQDIWLSREVFYTKKDHKDYLRDTGQAPQLPIISHYRGQGIANHGYERTIDKYLKDKESENWDDYTRKSNHSLKNK